MKNVYHAFIINCCTDPSLTHLTHICIGEMGHHCFRQWLVACSTPSHYLKQYLLIAIGLLETNFSEILIGLLPFSFKKIHLKMSSAKMAAILSKGRWVNCALHSKQTQTDYLNPPLLWTRSQRGKYSKCIYFNKTFLQNFHGLFFRFHHSNINTGELSSLNQINNKPLQVPKMT